MFRALKRLLQRGIFDPAQLTLRLFGPDGARPAVADPAPVPSPTAAPHPSVPRTAPPPLARRRRRPRAPEDEDAAVVATLVARHGEYNASRFGGTLRSVPIDLSRRMRSRLGYYRLATKTMPAMIMISRRHLRRHGWDETFQTLLHEMVHQWQAESGHTVDHGAQFRAKARAVGAVPRARRPVRGGGGRETEGDRRGDPGWAGVDWGSADPGAADVTVAPRRGR